MTTYQILDSLTKKNIINTVTGEQLTEIIRAGGGVHNVPVYKHIIQEIRSGKADKTRIESLKLQLPGFLPSTAWSGTKRTEGTESYVMAVLLDMDGKDNPNLIYHMNKVDAIFQQHAKLSFNSPKPDHGRKVLFEIDFATEQEYYIACELLKDNLNEKIKLATGGMTSGTAANFDENVKFKTGCFLSWDESAVWNTDGKIYTGIDYASQTHLISRIKQSGGGAFTVDLTNINISGSYQDAFDSMITKLDAERVEIRQRTLDALTVRVSGLARLNIPLNEIGGMLDAFIVGFGGYGKTTTTRKATMDKLARLVNDTHKRTRIVKPAAPKLTQYGQTIFNPFEYNHYLSEKLDLVWETLQNKKTIYISAPTGAGKTTLIKELTKLTGMKVDLYCPTTALAHQLHDHNNNILAITGEDQLEAEHRSAAILATCYESAKKIITSGRYAKIAVVDEAHELATAYDYRGYHIQELDRCLTTYDYVIYLSGTLYPVIDNIQDNRLSPTVTPYTTAIELANPIGDNYITFQPKTPTIVPYHLVKMDAKHTDYNYFVSTVNREKLHVFYKQDISVLLGVKDRLEQEAYSVLLVSADDKQDTGYQELINNSTLAGYDVLLCTSLIRAGVNILDVRPTRVVFGVATERNGVYNVGIVDYVQFAARWRKVVPAVEIVHKNELGITHPFNPSLQFTTATDNIHRIVLQKKIHEGTTIIDGCEFKLSVSFKSKDYNKKNPIKQRTAGVTRTIAGDLVVDMRYLQHKRYSRNTNNIQHNREELKVYLDAHNWNFLGVIDGKIKVKIDKRVKSAQDKKKHTKEEYAEQMITGKYERGATVKKLEGEMLKRYNALSKILPATIISTDMLVSDTKYKAWLSRGKYRVCTADATNGYALRPQVALWYEPYKVLAQLVDAGTTYPAEKLQDIVKAVTGKDYNTMVQDYIGVIYQMERKKVGGKNDRKYVYIIRKKHELSAYTMVDDNKDEYYQAL